jgi:hypothetical protein
MKSFHSFKAARGDVNIRHKRRFCFWLDVSGHQTQRIDKEALFSIEDSDGYSCIICLTHYKSPFELLARHVLLDYGEFAECLSDLSTCIYKSDKYTCGYYGSGPLHARFKGYFGRRLYYALHGKLCVCDCGYVCAKSQRLAVHYLVCTIDLSTCESPLLYSWYVYTFSSNRYEIDLKLHDGQAGWAKLVDEDIPSLLDLPRDGLATISSGLKKAEGPPVLALSRNSRGRASGRGPPAKIKSAALLTHERRTTFEIGALSEYLLLWIDCPLRLFPLVLCVAITTHRGKTGYGYPYRWRCPQPSREAVLAVGWTSKLAGDVEYVAATWNCRPLVVAYSNGGFTNTALSVVFLLAAMPFTFDVKIQSDDLVQAARDLDSWHEDCIEAAETHETILIRWTPDKSCWFRFDSRALARAIVDYGSGFMSDHILLFMPFVAVMY